MAQEIGIAKVVKGQMTASGPEGSRTLAEGNPVFKGDTLSFEHASDSVTVSLADGEATGDGTDTFDGFENVTGGSGADTIFGSDTANVIDGGSGDDSLFGNGGADTLLGGAGSDQFSLADPTSCGAVNITDYEAGADTLYIDALGLLQRGQHGAEQLH
jgi:Ca2+-binding RTX toxin-like protein